MNAIYYDIMFLKKLVLIKQVHYKSVIFVTVATVQIKGLSSTVSVHRKS